MGRPELSHCLVVPIPLSKKRERVRGFNQTLIIAAYFCQEFAYELKFDLKRIKHQVPQSSLNEQDRLINLQNAFRWTGPNLKGQSIILLDDVVTTGATLNEAARVLKAAGAGQSYGLVVAKG